MNKTLSAVSFAIALTVLSVFGLAGAAPQAVRAETEAEVRVRNEEMAEWRSKMEELRAAKNEIKERVRLQTAKKAQAIGLKRVNKLVDRLKKLKTTVSASTQLTDSEKATVNEKIDAEIVKLEDVATDVENATTVEAIKTAMTAARTQANASMKEIRTLIRDLRGTRLHNITKHLTEILERLNVKVAALTLTDAQKAEFAALSDSAKAYIAKADTAIDAKDYTGVKTNVAAAKKDLLSIIAKIKDVNEAASSAEDN